MGKGLAHALLLTTKEVFKGAAAISKVTAPGYLQMVLENSKPSIISEGKDDGSGYIRDVKLRYRTRGVPGKSVTEDNCSVQVRPAYKEVAIPATSYRALGMVFEDDLIARFERDALAPTRVGMTNLMKDVYEAMIEQLNGLFADINSDLLAVQAANFGKNASSGSNTAKTINFALSGATNPLNAGMTEIMADAMANEMKLQGAVIVGSGFINNYYLQQAAVSHNQSGLNTSQLALPKFYYDPYAASAFGANQFGLFEKDAVQFVNVCRFRGMKAGLRGSDFFFTMSFPIADSLGQGSLSGFEFDVQLSYRTCPEEVQIGAYEEGVNEPVLLQRGYNVILSSSYQIVHQPSDSFEATDRMFGVNGSLRYTATNT